MYRSLALQKPIRIGVSTFIEQTIACLEPLAATSVVLYFAGAMVAGFSVIRDGFILFLLVAVATFLWYARYNTSSSYVYNKRAKRLFLEHNFVGYSWQTEVCTFADMVAISVEVKRERANWLYTPVIVLSSKKTIAIAASVSNNLSAGNMVAEKMAKLMSLPFVSAQRGTLLRVKNGAQGSKTIVEHEKPGFFHLGLTPP